MDRRTIAAYSTGRGRRPLRAALVFVAAVLAAAVASGSVGSVGTARAEEPPAPRKVLVVSDSSLAALRWYTAAEAALVGADYTLDLESCRRLRGTSCSGREGRRPPTVLTVVNQAPADTYDTLLVFAGYNDAASSFGTGFEEIVAAARSKGIRRIVWTTLRVDVDYISPGNVSADGTFRSNNKVLRQKLASGRFPDVVVADWDAYTRRETEWFAADGVHFTVIGTWAAADYLTRKLAFLDARACPTPRRAGDPVQDPCPDPDLGPPDVDLVSLYPIDPNSLQCYEVGDERRIECRADANPRSIFQTLQFGAAGAEVKALQRRLVRLRFLCCGADGQFGQKTLAAVQAFQRARGLPITGVAGPATRAALGFGCPELVLGAGETCPADPGPAYLAPTLRIGANGAAVVALQRRLAQLGFNIGSIDGRYGTRVRSAVRIFQRQHGLRATGAADAATIAALGFAVAATVPASVR